MLKEVRIMYCIKCGKEMKEAAGVCPYCGERIVTPDMMAGGNVKSNSDFNRGMGIALLAGICILIRMMFGMGALIILAHWSQISSMLGNLF